ncbi:uncharacterized protein PHALS_05353 [Plasmopara halstedii]|uniref:Uncharacterized protein n=1 Tax=Plasmopara halstedii TaxID=4781 RepID=A0A0P1ABK9_PLAHL|nr:uncharacterized protein PHALS_05353 [Plasmopara halstedii]CEG37574.1 hypothetical protein PHALS_05353 [Plasmopara halstedii]|eukprot:XP_024573943.1 hypothetical protein PHALS_05353 [Plasmopara halstedii]
MVVSEQAQGQLGLWLVTQFVVNALNTKAIRCRVYGMATIRIGYYDSIRRTRDESVAFRKKGKKLYFHVLSETSAYFYKSSLHRSGRLTLCLFAEDAACYSKLT